MSLLDKVYQQIGESAVQQLKRRLPASGPHLSTVVDKGIRLIADGLSTVAQTEDGRHKLYEAIRYLDDGLIDDPDERFANQSATQVFAAGNDGLGELIGCDACDQLSHSLASTVDINQRDAKSVVGYLAPEVLGCLKREIDRGNVLDSPDGIGQLFFGNGAVSLTTESDSSPVVAEGKVSSLKVRGSAAGQSPSVASPAKSPAVPSSKKTPPVHSATSVNERATKSSAAPTAVVPTTGDSASDSVLGAAAASVTTRAQKPNLSSGAVSSASVERGVDTADRNGDDWSWLFRIALPILLMVGLVVAGVKNRGDELPPTAAAPLVADLDADGVEPSESELEALAAAANLQSELASVKDSAQARTSESNARIAALEAQIEEVTTEKAEALTKLEAVSIELEQSLSSGQAISKLTTQLNSLTIERDKAAEQIGLYQGQLDQSDLERESLLAELAELKQITNSQSTGESELKRELESMTAENNVNREAFKRLNRELVETQEALTASEESINELQAEIAETAAATVAAKAEFDRVNTELKSAKEDAKAVRVELDESNAEIVATRAEVETANAARAKSDTDYQARLESSETTRLLYQDEIDRLKTLLENAVATSNSKLAATEAESQQLLSGAVQDREELVEEINVLQSAKSELEEQLDQYAVELAMVSDNSSELQARLDSVEERLATTQSELETNLSLRNGFETQIEDLESKLDIARQSSSSDITRLTSVSNDLQSQLDLTIGARDEAQSSIAERDAQIAERDVIIEGLVSKSSELQSSVDSALVHVEQFQSDNAELQKTIEELTASTATLSGEMVQSTSAMARAETKIGELEQEIQKNTVQITQLRGERDALSSQQTRLEEAVDSISAERDKAIAVSATLKEQVTGLSSKLQQANVQSEDSLSRIDELKASLNNSERQLAVSADEANKFARQTNVLATETVRYQSEIKALRTERDKITAQVAALNREIGAFKNEVDGAHSDLAAAKEAEAESNRKVTIFSGNIDGLNKEIVRLKDEHEVTVKELNQSINDLRADRDQAKSESTEALAKAASIDGEKSEMMSVVSELQSAFDSSQAEVVSLANQLASLEEEVESLNSARDNALAEAAELRDEVVAAESQVIETKALADSYKLTLDRVDEMHQAEVEAINAIRDAITSSLSDVEVDDVQVTTRDNNSAVGITIGSGNLFRAGSADLSRDGSDVLSKVGDIVANYENWKIDVEGHTDNQPIGGALLERYPSNWELSVARASTAVRFLQIDSGIDPALLSARGFGETRPLDAADTPEARRKNRRVEVVLRKIK